MQMTQISRSVSHAGTKTMSFRAESRNLSATASFDTNDSRRSPVPSRLDFIGAAGYSDAEES